jgi:hypothetical protein
MSVPNTNSRIQYTLASATQTVAVPFFFLEEEHLKVIRLRAGVYTTLTLATHYTTTGENGEAGGSVIFNGAGTAIADVITIIRSIPISQLVDFVYNGRFPGETVERALDRLTMVCQALSEVLGRTIRFEAGEVLDGEMELAGRLGKMMSFNATTGALEYTDVQAILDEAIEQAAIATAQAAIATTQAGIATNEAEAAAASAALAAASAESVDGPALSASITDLNESTYPLIPKLGTGYFFGDSQTAGINAASKPYTSGGYVIPAYRWTDKLCTKHDRALTVSNQGYGGSRISYRMQVGDAANNWESHYNRLGNLPYNWTGMAVFMCGWNNTASANEGSAEYYKYLRFAHEAVLDRANADGWYGVTHLGWTHLSPVAATPGWSTNVVASNTEWIIGAAGKTNPFYYQDDSGARYTFDLGASKYVSLVLTNKRACGIHFDVGATSGEVLVKVNDVPVGTWTLVYNDPLAGDIFPVCIHLEGLPPTAVIRVENVSGTAKWLGITFKDADTSKVSNRSILYGSVVGNTANGRTKTHLYEVAKTAEAAAGVYGQFYPVYFSNNFSNWLDSTDQEPTDISHLTDIGNETVFRNFSKAYRVPYESSPNFVVLDKSMFGLTSNGTLLSYQTASGGSFYKFQDPSTSNTLLDILRQDGTGAASNDATFSTFADFIVCPNNAPTVRAMLVNKNFTRLFADVKIHPSGTTGFMLRLGADDTPTGANILGIKRLASDDSTASNDVLFKAFNQINFRPGNNAGSDVLALSIQNTQIVTSLALVLGGIVRLKSYTVATLPAGVAGDTAFVTDATAPTYLGALIGGGAVKCPVFFNGTAWVSS